MDINNVKMVVTIPESGPYGYNKQGKMCLGLTWPDGLELTHRVLITRTSISAYGEEDKQFVSKEKIPIQSLGGLLQKISEAVNGNELVVDFCNDKEIGEHIYIEVYDDYRE